MPGKAQGPEIERLIQMLARLPGLGARSARKAALALIRRKADLLEPLAAALGQAAEKIVTCPVCYNVDTISPCAICQDPRRDPGLIVVVEGVGDLWALERAGVVNGRYHVLGGHLSPLDHLGPDDLTIGALIERAKAPELREVLLALSATVEGQSTAHYVMGTIARPGLSVSMLALGVPLGGELDHLDDGTLAAAVRSRRPVG